MKCGRPSFLDPRAGASRADESPRPVLPDTLTDRLTGDVIPFSNRDNIRQKILGFLLDERGFHKEDFRVDREICFDLDGQKFVSLVDISVVFDGRTVMAWKCASGSLVSRERQIIASARLLEDYVVPFAAVTNGADIEVLDSLSEAVSATGFAGVPSRDELMKAAEGALFRPVKGRKIVNEQRILYTYDGISCPVSCKTSPEKS
ncbi:MAG: type I restriction enzyme HsdR N-terminal domain-containing protein [Nitrospiraceae bacterium]|nr:type I restriction enzyme HsdR N-terminal domain-containing protein [Nitrospiraceae bacterium]